MMATTMRAGLAILLSTGVFAQTSSRSPAAGPGFDVASVKPSVPRPGRAAPRTGGPSGAGCPTQWKTARGRVDVECATLPMLIGYAYRSSPDRVTGPDWMTAVGSPRFDIHATFAAGALVHSVPEMFQALLSDRFQLTFHRAGSPRMVYALVPAKGGARLQPSTLPTSSPAEGDVASGEFYGATETRTIPDADGNSSTTILSSPSMGTVRETGDPLLKQRWEASHITLEGLADLLDKVAPVSVPIVDQTGIKGRFHLVLEVSLRDARPGMASAVAPPGGESELEAVVVRAFNDGLRKFGLRLERRKGTVQVLVVDRIERTPSEN